MRKRSYSNLTCRDLATYKPTESISEVCSPFRQPCRVMAMLFLHRVSTADVFLQRQGVRGESKAFRKDTGVCHLMEDAGGMSSADAEGTPGESKHSRLERPGSWIDLAPDR